MMCRLRISGCCFPRANASFEDWLEALSSVVMHAKKCEKDQEERVVGSDKKLVSRSQPLVLALEL